MQECEEFEDECQQVQMDLDLEQSKLDDLKINIR